MEPGAREPAPEPLRLVQLFANTKDVSPKPGTRAKREELLAWLRDHGATLVSESEFERVIAFRDAVRAMIFANDGEPLDTGAIETFNRIAMHHAPLGVQIDAAGVATLAPRGEGVDVALGRVIAAIFGAMADGTWGRLKICRMDDCLWAFYDRSKNNHGAWCSMAVCGSRSKARAYRARKSSQSTVDSSQ